MKVNTSWCSYKDEKLDKLDAKYLKNVEFIKDLDDRTREVGEINFLTIPAEKLIEVLNHVKELELEHNYHKKSANWSDDDYYDLTDEMEEYRSALIGCLNMYEKDLFDLTKKFIYLICVVKDTEKYETFAKILNATCKLSYMDYDDYEYCDYIEHPHPSQEDVDHNYVGDYELLMNKPIPLKVIQAMKNEINKLEKIKIKKDTEEFDKKFSNEILDELTKKL